MFSLPRPIGTAIPHPPIYALANFDPTDIAGSIGSQLLGDPTAPLQFPTVNRKGKGDSRSLRGARPMPPLPPLLADRADAGTSGAPLKNDDAASPRRPLRAIRVSAVAGRPAAPDVELPYADHAAEQPCGAGADRHQADRATFISASIRWLACEKRSRLGRRARRRWYRRPAIPTSNCRRSAPDDRRRRQSRRNHRQQGRSHRRRRSGRSRRPSGWRLTGSGARQGGEVPRQRGLFRSARRAGARDRSRWRRWCMNRVFSPFYPNDVCGVVYQNAKPASRLPVHVRLRRHPRRGHRAGRLGARQAHRPRHARRQAVDAGSGEVDPLSRLLGAPELGRRNEEDGQARRASPSIARALGATAPTSRTGATPRRPPPRLPSYKTAYGRGFAQ